MMSLLAVLPVAAFLSVFISLFRRCSSFRFSWVWASLIWAACAVVLTETLSLGHLLTPGMTAIGWGLVIAIVTFLKVPAHSVSTTSFKFSFFENTILGMTAAVLLSVGINAFFAAPNNWDSMTYHLPRIMHWIDNRSVEHYATAILRQLYQPPGAEYLILQFQILTGNDRFANLIQWFAMIGTAVTLSLIAAELGAGRKGQILTAFLSVTIPMGILQGSSTQNDYVAGFWLAVFVLLGLQLLCDSRWPNVVGTGLALGLVLLTKGTGYIFAAPWVGAFILFGLIKKRKIFLRDLFVIALICFALNAAFYTRNVKLFGSPISAGTEDYINKGNIIGNGIANVVRNTALHMGTPFLGFNKALKDNIIKLSGQDESNSWGDFDILSPSTSEDVAGNPLHLLLMISTFAAVFLSRYSSWLLRYAALLVIAGFLLFCVFLKWQLFHSRLHLPLFLLSMPIAAIILEKNAMKWFTPVIVALLLAAAIPPLFFNERHPLVGSKNVFNMGRIEQYFSYRKFMAVPYIYSVKYATLKSSSDVGLWLGGDDWEYPLWILLKKENPDVHIWHRGVTNISARLTLERAKQSPVIISEIEKAPIVVEFDNTIYLRQRNFAFMNIYEERRKW